MAVAPTPASLAMARPVCASGAEILKIKDTHFQQTSNWGVVGVLLT